MHGAPFGLLPPGVQGVAHAACRAPGWRSRRWWWCRRTPPRACRFRKSSALVVPPNGMSRCVWASMPPGITYMPVASMIFSADSGGMPLRTSLMRSSSIRTSAALVSVAVTTVPLRISVRWHASRSQDCTGRPVSTCSMVMQFSTGQTSQQRLQPTHSASSTWGMRSGGVGVPPAARSASSLAIGVTVRRARLAASSDSGRAVAIQVDALVRAVPAGDVAEVAADALIAIDAGDDLVIQVEVLPLGDLGDARGRGNRRVVRKPFSSIQLLRPSIMSSTMR